MKHTLFWSYTVVLNWSKSSPSRVHMKLYKLDCKPSSIYQEHVLAIATILWCCHFQTKYFVYIDKRILFVLYQAKGTKKFYIICLN